MALAGLTIAALLIPAVWGEYEPDCWFANKAGDRFVFGDQPWEWVYVPAKGEPEGCVYGLDPDVGEYTVTCLNFDEPVLNDAENTVSILGELWTATCPDAAPDLGI